MSPTVPRSCPTIRVQLTALVDASNLPLSLLIVGVGNEDFKAMEVSKARLAV